MKKIVILIFTLIITLYGCATKPNEASIFVGKQLDAIRLIDLINNLDSRNSLWTSSRHEESTISQKIELYSAEEIPKYSTFANIPCQEQFTLDLGGIISNIDLANTRLENKGSRWSRRDSDTLSIHYTLKQPARFRFSIPYSELYIEKELNDWFEMELDIQRTVPLTIKTKDFLLSFLDYHEVEIDRYVPLTMSIETDLLSADLEMYWALDAR